MMDDCVGSTEIGLRRRMSRLFREDGFAVCVAGDYGLSAVPTDNVYHLRRILGEVIQAGPDGVLLSPGQITHMAALFASSEAPAVMMRCDWMNAPRLKGGVAPAHRLRRMIISSPTEALRLDAVAVVSWLFLGYDDSLEAENIRDEEKLVSECHRIGLPCGIEPLDMGVLSTGVVRPAVLERGAKMASERGADFLKIPYSGSIESFKRVVAAAGGIPVLVLGGRRAGRVQDALDMADDAKRAGASGVVFGRNVTQAEDPGFVVRSLCRLFHG